MKFDEQSCELTLSIRFQQNVFFKSTIPPFLLIISSEKVSKAVLGGNKLLLDCKSSTFFRRHMMYNLKSEMQTGKENSTQFSAK